MTPRSRKAIVVASALLIAVAGVYGHERHRRAVFRSACKRIFQGETPESVSRRLREAGGEEEGVSEQGPVWYLEGLFRHRAAICTVQVDKQGVVIGAVARGGRPDRTASSRLPSTRMR
jgi:hypothetical protein